LVQYSQRRIGTMAAPADDSMKAASVLACNTKPPPEAPTTPGRASEPEPPQPESRRADIKEISVPVVAPDEKVEVENGNPAAGNGRPQAKERAAGANARATRKRTGARRARDRRRSRGDVSERSQIAAADALGAHI